MNDGVDATFLADFPAPADVARYGKASRLAHVLR
jgi:hypothetical protein